jgi:hypothetical protein
MSEKPVIFISHSSKDGDLARLLKQQIELCFSNDVEVFAADINPGENWFDKVMSKLNLADAIAVLITPDSVNSSHWVWFELGYFWARHDDSLRNSETKQKIYYPLYVNGIEWPNPVEDLKVQAALLSSAGELGNFFNQLCQQFKNGNTARIDLEAIIELAANYAKQNKAVETKSKKSTVQSRTDSADVVQIADKDQESYEKLKEWIWRQRDRYQIIDFSMLKTKEHIPNIFDGRLIYYKELDDELHIRWGTSKNLLKAVALEFKLVPTFEGYDTIKFKRDTE